MLTHMTHNRTWFLLITAVSFLIIVSSKPAQADNPVIIVMQVVPGSDIDQIAVTYGLSVQDRLPALDLYRLQGNDPSVIEALAADSSVLAVAAEQYLHARPSYIHATSDLLAAQPSYIHATGASDPNEAYQQQEALTQIRLSQAQTLADGHDVLVAVLDTGVDTDHPFLVDHLVAGYDFVDDDADPEEVIAGIDSDNDGQTDEAAGHGSHVAGIVALVAPQAAIMPLRVFDSDGMGTYFDTAAAIVYAVDQGAQVINLSGNGPEDVPFLQTAVDYAWSHDVLVVASGGINHLGYPAGYAHVISVGSVDSHDYRLDFAHFDPDDVTVYAPGFSIFSAYYDGGYAWWTGHSMATPFVAGEAALLLSSGSCNYLCATATISQATFPVQNNPPVNGRIDLYDAVAEASGQINPDLQVLYRTGSDDSVNDQMIKPYFTFTNEGNSIAWQDLTVRYWFHADTDAPNVFNCDYAAIGCTTVTDVISMTDIITTSNAYLELNFMPEAGMLWGGQRSGEIQVRMHQEQWQPYDESNDFSYTFSQQYVPWDRVTLYYQGNLVWGQEPFATSTPPPDPLPAGVHAQYRAGDTNATNSEARPFLQIRNDGPDEVPLNEMTLRYWYTDDSNTAVPISVCDYAALGCSQINTTFHLAGVQSYMEVGFTDAAGVLPVNHDTGPIQLRFYKPDWSPFDETTHYSFDASKVAFADWENVTLYRNGVLIWGNEP